MGESGFPTPFSCSITAALLDSLIAGADGYNGVMANFHLDLCVWMYRNSREKPGQARRVIDFLTVAAVMEALRAELGLAR